MALPRGQVTFGGAPAAPRVGVDVARTDADRERGLMYRTTIPSDEGMIFVWTNESVRTFWMHNTCIPLDMVFLAADGTVVGVVEQAPTLDDGSRGVPCPAAFVLEVNAGWARAHGVAPGQQARIDL